MRRTLRSTAPVNSPIIPENSLKSGFSTPWKKFFHGVETPGFRSAVTVSAHWLSAGLYEGFLLVSAAT